MKKEKDILRKLRSDILQIENIIENPKVYNSRNAFICSLASYGIVLNKVFPFFLVAPSLFFIWPKGSKPFILESHPIYSTIVSTDTSLGEHIEEEVVKTKQGNSIEYSTGWVLMDDNLYERTVTSYRYKDSYFKEKDSLLGMSKEELDDKLSVFEVRTVRKEELEEKDHFYDKDMLVIKTSWRSSNVVGFELDSPVGNIIETFLYLYFVFIGGFSFMMIYRSYGPGRDVENKLIDIQLCHDSISKKDLVELRKILKMRKENLALLEQDSCTSLKLKKEKVL